MGARRKQWIAGCAALLFIFAALFFYRARAEERMEFETVLVHTDCAPWDGPALEIEFYTSPARCDENRASILRISLWQNLPPRAGQKIQFGRDPKLGAAGYCPQENHCEAAESGSVFIESYERGKGASGRYDLKFPKAGRLSGRFRAAWCETRELCG